MDSVKLLRTTGCAAFASDEDGVITGWNKAAEELLGYREEEVVGKPCAEVICGTDVFGNRFCNDSCAIQSMVRRGEAVQNFQLDIRGDEGESFRAGLCTLVVHGEERGRYSLIHLFQPLEQVSVRSISENGKGMRPGGVPGAAGSPLTAREREVLMLLEEGVPTQRMAEAMRISVTTVRNHIQGILRKLGAHSRLEAVSSARRQGML